MRLISERMLRLAAVVLAVIGVTAGCDLQTAGSPKGALVVTARYVDSQDLVVGHSAQVSGVRVGTVTAIDLVQSDGSTTYEAKVTMSIQSNRRIPIGAVAVLTRTSLLGEHTIDIRIPEGVDPTAGPFLEPGDNIDKTEVEPDFEQVAKQGIDVATTIGGDQLATILNAGVDSLSGRGPTLNTMIAQLSHVMAATAAQRGDLAAAIDGIGQLTSTFAPMSTDVMTLIDEVTSASATLAQNRDRLVTTLDQVVRAATDLNDRVLLPHGDQLLTLLQQLDPVAQTLADSRDNLDALISNLLTVNTSLPRLVHDDALILYLWFAGAVRPDGSTLEPPVTLSSLLAPVPETEGP